MFTTRTGRPIEPRNVYRSFTRVAGNAGLRVIRLHDARHGCLLTVNVYAHVVQDTQREAVSHMDRLLTRRLQRE